MENKAFSKMSKSLSPIHFSLKASCRVCSTCGSFTFLFPLPCSYSYLYPCKEKLKDSGCSVSSLSLYGADKWPWLIFYCMARYIISSAPHPLYYWLKMPEVSLAKVVLPKFMYFQRWHGMKNKWKQWWIDYFSLHVSLVGIFERKE